MLTKVPAPTTTLSPMAMSPKTTTFAPRVTLSPMTGRFELSSWTFPTVVLFLNVKFRPMRFAFNTVEEGWYIVTPSPISDEMVNVEVSFRVNEQRNALHAPILW